MKRLLTSTTALSVALAFTPPMPLMAQSLTDDGKVVAADGTVLCDPAVGAACDLENIRAQVQAAAAQAVADAAEAAQADAAAAQAAADAAAAAQADAAAQAAADAAAAAQADAAAAKAAADAAAAAQADAAAAQAEADAAAAAQADAAAAQAEADAAAAAQADAAAAQAAADAAAAAQADAAAAQAEADAAAQAEADAAAQTDAAAAAQAAADAAALQAQSDADAAAATLAADDAAAAADLEAAAAAVALQAEVDAAAAETTAVDPAVSPDGVPPLQPEAAAPVVVTEQTAPDAPVEILVPEDSAVQGLEALMETPSAADTASEALIVAPAAAAAAAESTTPATDGTRPSDVAAPADAVVTTQTVTDTDARRSSEEFSAAPVQVGDNKKSGLSNLEKVGLVALGALVVGAVINENNKKDRQQVVSNTGDRVVVQRPDGSYQVYKDDDAILRRPGSTVRTESYRDGSTRTIVEKADGTQIVTVRDASGRVLRRATYDDRGREQVLFDDLRPERPIIISDLPRPRADRVIISTRDENAALKARLAAREAEKIGRSFSLRQIREISQVRDLAATIDVDTITFDSGSSAIRASEAEKLADLGGLITDLIANNPAEVFLIEGHTDAVGGAASNLALSDRRAESVALALTEYFGVPPENLVVQGYGEKELRIDTEAAERANRRVAVRVITPLMSLAAN